MALVANAWPVAHIVRAKDTYESDNLTLIYIFPQIPGGLGRLLRGCGVPHGAGGDVLPERVPRRARQRLPGRGQLADTGAGLVRPGGQ